MQRGLGRGFQAPEFSSGDSPLAFPAARTADRRLATTGGHFPATRRLRSDRKLFIFELSMDLN